MITENASASPRVGASAPCYGRGEDVGVVPVVIAELELGNVKRQVLGADLVECAHDPALDERPEGIDGLSVDRADHIFATRMANEGVGEILGQADVGTVLIGCEQIDFGRNRFADEALKGLSIGVPNYPSDHVALTADRADHDFLAGSAGSWRPLIPMPVLVFAADVGFVHLDYAHELTELGINQSGADTIAHVMRSLIRAEAHHAVDLERANSLLAGQHKVDHAEPRPQRDIRVLENCSDQHREAVSAWQALVALPVERSGLQFGKPLVSATRAPNASRPAARDQVGFAGIVIREQLAEFGFGHLPGELGLAAHGSAPRL